MAPGEGSVRVKVVGKRLMITGDNLDNLITVEKGPTPNSYRVTGLAGTQINGRSGSFVFENVTRGIDANLKGGDDMLVLDGSASPFTVPGTIKVRTGRGDDLVRLQGVTPARPTSARRRATTSSSSSTPSSARWPSTWVTARRRACCWTA